MRQISKEEFDRNIDNLKTGKDLEVSLVQLKEFMRNKYKLCYGSTHQNKIRPWNIYDIIKIKKSSYPLHLKLKNCMQCGKQFQGRLNKKYCSKKCKKKGNNQKIYNYFNRRMKTDWQFALKVRLRDNLRDAIRYYNKTGKLRKHVRSDKYIDYPGIIKSLGPCPGERRGWHIDHIKPLCSFNFSDTSEIKKAFAPENLRWLPAKENLKKGVKI